MRGVEALGAVERAPGRRHRHAAAGRGGSGGAVRARCVESCVGCMQQQQRRRQHGGGWQAGADGLPLTRTARPAAAPRRCPPGRWPAARASACIGEESEGKGERGRAGVGWACRQRAGVRGGEPRRHRQPSATPSRLLTPAPPPPPPHRYASSLRPWYRFTYCPSSHPDRPEERGERAEGEERNGVRSCRGLPSVEARGSHGSMQAICQPLSADAPSISHSSSGEAGRSMTPNHWRARARAVAQRAATAGAQAGRRGAGRSGQVGRSAEGEEACQP